MGVDLPVWERTAGGDCLVAVRLPSGLAPDSSCSGVCREVCIMCTICWITGTATEYIKGVEGGMKDIFLHANKRREA
jgi:hypothetical protein